MALGDVVKNARKRKGWTQEQLAVVAGVSRHHILNIEKGANVSVDVLQRIAKALDLTRLPLGALVFGEEDGDGDASQIADRVMPESASECVSVRVYGEVAAGEPIESTPEDDTVLVPVHAIELGEFILRVRGDSMMDEGIEHGDLLVVEPRPTGIVRSNEIVVALLNGGITVKRWWRKHGIKKLIAANASHGERVLTDADDFRLQGVVTGVIKKGDGIAAKRKRAEH